MQKLELTQGKYALVDDSSYERLVRLGRLWQATKRDNIWYAKTDFWNRKTKRRRVVYLHRWIMRASKKDYVDHKNGDGLDNRRQNLRLVTQSQNMLNRHQKTFAESGYRGVRQVQNGVGWSVYFKHEGKQLSVGTFQTAELAACARDYHVIDLGLAEYARLNFVEQPHSREEVKAGRTFSGAEYPNIRFKDGKWEANVREHGRKRYIGRFDTLDQALLAQRLSSPPTARYMRRVVS